MAKQLGKLTGRTDSSAGTREQIVRSGDRTQPTSAAIAALAYELWRARGCPEGSPETDWFQAEQNRKAEKKLGASSPRTI
jgi:hypothetical protein